MARLWRALRVFLSLQTCLYYGFASGLEIDLDSTDSIKDVSRQLAASAMKYYDGNLPGKTPGLLPGDFNWWEAGALFGQMVEYWYYTGDDTYNDITKQALLYQVGPNNAYEPENQTRTEGNDDQAFWAFAAMSAAELKFPDPAPDQPQWLALAQAVFNNQAGRWDTKHCSGGLRWQFNPFNNGYNEKNTISNGCFFQLAARLARYTKNDTYAQWADKTYDWISQSPLMNEHYEVFDGMGFSETACPSGDPGYVQWSYNMGTMIAGSAFMYNYTNGDEKWKTRLTGLLTNTQKIFFPAQYGNSTMVEYACEPIESCNRDQRSFKAYLSRWLAVALQVAPFSAPIITPWLQTSAKAAVKVCTGGPPDGVVCGRKWWDGKDDGTRDVGNQMCAMSIVQANLASKVPGIADVSTGTSVGNAGAGGGNRPEDTVNELAIRRYGTAEKVGAWLITAFITLVVLGTGVVLCNDDFDFATVTGWFKNGIEQVHKGKDRA